MLDCVNFNCLKLKEDLTNDTRNQKSSRLLSLQHDKAMAMTNWDDKNHLCGLIGSRAIINSEKGVRSEQAEYENCSISIRTSQLMADGRQNRLIHIVKVSMAFFFPGPYVFSFI